MPPPVDDVRLDAALDALLALDEGAARAAWLAEARQRDPALAEQVETLLAQADGLPELDTGPGALADDLVEQYSGLTPGDLLGAWRVLHPLGRGGMGRVYLAERADGAFDKRVAVKVLRRELDLPPEVLRRERALLARLEHPGVTRLLDGGVSDGGDIYLVMEHVDGTPLLEWCRQHGADAAARVTLFLQVAEAVADAHRQRVVHGDIKPGNVLVTAERRARLLDFGVAQLAELPDGSGTELRALTPQFAAPECLRGEASSIRSDIYSLGALLHALLPQAAAVRALPRSADLEAIIAKATAAEPGQRYADVPQLLADIQRWRRCQPVTARGAGGGYRLRRFMRRHWFASTASSVLAAVVLAAAGALAWQNGVVRSERDQARLAESRSQIVLDYLMGLLGHAGDAPASAARPLPQLLADSLDNIDRDFAGDAVARQELLARLGELHVRLNDFATADTLLSRFVADADGSSPPALRARAFDQLAVVRLHQGKLDEARALVSRALGLLQDVAGDSRGQRAQVLVTRARLQQRSGKASDAIATLRQALALRLAVSPADAAQTVVVRNSLAVALMRSGDYAGALAEFRQLEQALVSSNRSHSLDAANIYNNHASTAFAYGLYGEADRLFARALKLQRELYGPSAALAALLNNVGKLKLALGDIATGRQHIQDAVAMMETYAGEHSIDARLVRLSLGQLALSEGRPADARDIYKSIGDSLSGVLGDTHPLIARVRARQLVAHARSASMPASDPAFDRMLARLGSAPSSQRPRAQLLCHRAELALAQQRNALAATSAQACARLRQTNQAERSAPRLVARYLLAEARLRDAPDPARRAERDAALQALTAQLGEDHPTVQRLAAL